MDKQGTPKCTSHSHCLVNHPLLKDKHTPDIFIEKNVLTWTALSFGLLILSLRVRNSQTLTVGDIDDAHSQKKKKKKEKNREQTNKQDCFRRFSKKKRLL